MFHILHQYNDTSSQQSHVTSSEHGFSTYFFFREVLETLRKSHQTKTPPIVGQLELHDLTNCMTLPTQTILQFYDSMYHMNERFLLRVLLTTQIPVEHMRDRQILMDLFH